MSNFPSGYDDDVTIPPVNDNITEIGGEAINSLRDAVFSIEQYLGLGGNGTTSSISNRIDVSLFPDGTIRPSAISSLGLVTLPITNNQISPSANIVESKLKLDHRTQDLFNYIRDLSGDVNFVAGWINTIGVKLNPHLSGVIYNHSMNHIYVSTNVNEFFQSNKRVLRDNNNLYTLFNDTNNELINHQWADGSASVIPYNITTNNGSVFSSYFAHTGSGIFINPNRFDNVPKDKNNLQLFAEFIDDQLLGLNGIVKNLYSNGISRSSSSSSLLEDGYGQNIILSTQATTFLKNTDNLLFPFDSIDSGDDIIEFKPSLSLQNNNSFDAKFALVKVGDIIRVNYGNGIDIPFIIKEKKYFGDIGNKKYVVRIAGKNLLYTTNAFASVYKPLFNRNKFGELSISPVNNQFSETPSLIINSPRSAQALGLGFNPDQFDENHYLLYLALFPTGNPQDGYTILPAIDVTGNQGTTPGLYTLESIVQATNDAFRKPGFNYRFTAFSYHGEFGICLADSYNNAGFSIVSTTITPSGTIDTIQNQVSLPKNVIDLQPIVGNIGQDPLGFGPTGSNIASPPYYSTYGSSAASLNATKLFIPLKRNNFYVNGNENERFPKENSQLSDINGDGYWIATVQDVQTPGSARVQTTYRVPFDLSTSGLKIGKTLVVQPINSGNLVDSGRYIIQSVIFGCSPTIFTDITVYDSVHAFGSSPISTILPFENVRLYFTSDSVSFNIESATDLTISTPFKRHFEVYIDKDGQTFTHERARINISGSTRIINDVPLYSFSDSAKINIVRVSPKLRGASYGEVNKIALRIFTYSSANGVYEGALGFWDGSNFTHYGPRIIGRKGQVTRFYDETNTDYIEIIFDINESISSFTDQITDFQLFPSLSLDDELMLLGTCQVNDITKIVNKIVDARQFGNTSEKDLSSSVFDYISVSEKHLHSNGIVRGFDIYQTFNGSNALISLSGGIVLVNGKFININNDSITIPAIRERYNSTLWNVNWLICVNDIGEYKLIPMLDSDTIHSTPIGVPDRIFSATDLVSLNNYNMQSGLFSDLANRKDLVPLYIVSSTVTGSQSSVNVSINTKDARKFVYQKDWSQRVTLTSNIEGGDFRSFESLASWLRFNANHINLVNVRGLFNGNVPTTFSFNAPKVRFFGDGAATFQVTAITTVSNIEFNYIIWSATAKITFNTVHLNDLDFTTDSDLDATDSVFENVVFNFTNSIKRTINFTKCKFKGCIFNVTKSEMNFEDCNIVDCIFNYTTSDIDYFIYNQSDVIPTTINSVFNMTNPIAMQLSGLFKDNIFNYTNKDISFNVLADIQMIGNQFIAANNTPISNFMFLDNGTRGILSHNNFFRNNNALTAYIAAPNPGNAGTVIITDNFFDSTHIGDPNQSNILVSNLPNNWIYQDNGNASFTLPIKKIVASDYSFNSYFYSVISEDYILALELDHFINIFLPKISLSPKGRVIIIKDILGTSDTNNIRVVPSGTDKIENINTTLVYSNPFGSLTLVSTGDSWIKI